jgi:DNA-directed RNA polymerase III subunit RPC3
MVKLINIMVLQHVTMPFSRYVDLAKACSVLLGNLYKTLYNINARKQAETEDRGIKAVSEKRERSDVSQNEGLLTRNERETLREWELRIEKLTVLEARVEEVVFILNDFGACQDEPT